MLTNNNLIRLNSSAFYMASVFICMIILSVASITSSADSGFVEQSFSGQGFVGVQQCKTCHATEYQQWKDSDHDWAMRTANEKSVLGDFNNTELDHFGSKTRFYRKDAGYFVETENSEGHLQEFKISYTFGFFPLQQYLIVFPDGRYQALSVAWDSRPSEAGGQRWFHLYPDEAISHKDVLHWTGTYFNWNSRCAACHSTNLERHYNAEKNTYKTTWSEINVSCEACHGPGKDHVQWARETPDKKIPHAGFIASLSPVGEWLKTEDRATAAHQGKGNENQVAACGSCHARRAQLTEPMPAGTAAVDFHNHFQLALLDDALYYPDGQIKDEVFEMGSFTQSKMFHKGVACSNCHEPHSLKLRREGNLVCTQCHTPAVFDTPKHHHHPQDSEGAQCANCHMPKTTYMVIDERADHSIRIPRPDLSDHTGAPNACTNCHQQESNQWATKAVQTWLTAADKTLPNHYSETLAAAHAGTASVESIADLVNNTDVPTIVRASAMQLLPQTATNMALAQQQLGNQDPLIRMRAVSQFESLPREIRTESLLPLLNDKTKIVRLETARVLADIHPESLSESAQQQLANTFNEYIKTQQVNADTHEAQINLGIFYSRRGLHNEAQKSYQQAIKLAPAFPVSYINSADLYRELNDESNAESMLRDGLARAPLSAQLHYALGLSLVRQKRYAEAELAISEARMLEPTNENYLRIYVILLDHLGKLDVALETLKTFTQNNKASQPIIDLQKQLLQKAGQQLKPEPAQQKQPQIAPAKPTINSWIITAGLLIVFVLLVGVIFYVRISKHNGNLEKQKDSKNAK